MGMMAKRYRSVPAEPSLIFGVVKVIVVRAGVTYLRNGTLLIGLQMARCRCGCSNGTTRRGGVRCFGDNLLLSSTAGLLQRVASHFTGLGDSDHVALKEVIQLSKHWHLAKLKLG